MRQILFSFLDFILFFLFAWQICMSCPFIYPKGKQTEPHIRQYALQYTEHRANQAFKIPDHTLRCWVYQFINILFVWGEMFDFDVAGKQRVTCVFIFNITNTVLLNANNRFVKRRGWGGIREEREWNRNMNLRRRQWNHGSRSTEGCLIVIMCWLIVWGLPRRLGITSYQSPSALPSCLIL